MANSQFSIATSSSSNTKSPPFQAAGSNNQSVPIDDAPLTRVRQMQQAHEVQQPHQHSIMQPPQMPQYRRNLSADPQSSTTTASAERSSDFDIQEYIAQLLSNPDTWRLLSGPGEKNDHFLPKKQVHGIIAQKFNTKFSTETSPINLDEMNIKNKIENMKRRWKDGNAIAHRTGSGNLDEQTLEKQVKEVCNYYYILKDVSSSSWSLNRRDPVQFTGNISRPGTAEPNHDTGGETNDKNDEDNTAVESEDNRSGNAPIGSTSMSSTRKRGSNTASDVLTATESLSSGMDMDHELKRRRLVMDERANERADEKIRLENELIKIQIKKIEAEIEIARITVQADIARQDRLIEIEYMKVMSGKRDIFVFSRNGMDPVRLEISSSVSPPGNPKQKQKQKLYDH
ncbi:hypothetical protein BGZ76_000982 [Entomortierella beljakovae]|nr:hypothetical protein BGZ76_000982 [Entomortierella beljakovae]